MSLGESKHRRSAVVAPETRIPANAPSSEITAVSGVGPARSGALGKRGILTLADALMHLPYRYEDLRRRDDVASLCAGMRAVVEGTLQNVTQRPMRGMRGRWMTSAFLKQASGKGIRVIWFNLRGSMPSGRHLVLAGRVTCAADGTLELLHPEIHRLGSEGVPAIRPIYALPVEVPQRLFAAIIEHALSRPIVAGDSIPPELRADERQPSVAEALRYLHQPLPDTDLEQLQVGESQAHRALALDEMFAFQLALARERARSQTRRGAVLNGEPRLTSALIAGLPFAATGSQLHAIEEIAAELAQPSQMNRILIGDVGSGKTLVAFHAALRAVESGWQVAMMAPTELLAEQHFTSFGRLCRQLGVTAALLTGKSSTGERARLLRALRRGDVAMLFGTHALFQEGVAMPRLGLAIIDEQHRFGVFDRARLIALGSQANVLLMTATPIPRSLALALFRNLSVSMLDEMPPGRTPVLTQVFAEDALPAVDAMMRAELQAGRRGYYVLPLIEGGDEDPDSVIATAKRLAAGPLGEFSIAVLHGRMRPAEKDLVMRRFRDGDIQILVATTVVEVGIDVPEATVIVIVAAERYGLAQLHQLRGRVGRGTNASRCCLVISKDSGPQALARIEALAKSGSGREVAELDLKLRGPGDLLGARQTGALTLRFAGLIRDFELIERAGDMAEEWLRRDPDLRSAASACARQAIARMLEFGFSLGDIG